MRGASAQQDRYDAIIVGAGFAGLYMLYRLRAMGLKAIIFEAGEGVGGTWYWNRYPGARCDVESMEYSYSFSKELEAEWTWTERYPAQPEILRYLQYVAERFDLMRDIRLNTRVSAAHFQDDAGRWTITTEAGEVASAQICVMATGCLSSWRIPEIPGRDDFDGPTYHTGDWPHEGVDFTGKRVGVIGTGSSGIQAIPVIAEQAASLYVFQRTPNFSVPAQNGPLSAEKQAAFKADREALREKARHTASGTLSELAPQSALAVEPSARRAIFERAWVGGGFMFMNAFNDLLVNRESNGLAAEFVREKIRGLVDDPEVAEALSPTGYPIGTKRICVDTNYYATFNRPNVHLVNLRKAPLDRIVEAGIRTSAQTYELDAIVFATGFDAMTGSLGKIDLRGRHGRTLKAKWAAGPRTYLGLMSAGFPNLFMITGPGSPSVLSNMVVAIEQHVEWIADCLAWMEAEGVTVIEADQGAEDAWVDHVNEVAHCTLYPQAASWYMGANVPGKARVFMPYVGGVGAYRSQCDAVAAEGYRGFELTRAASAGSQAELQQASV